MLVVKVAGVLSSGMVGFQVPGRPGQLAELLQPCVTSGVKAVRQQMETSAAQSPALSSVACA